MIELLRGDARAVLRGLPDRRYRCAVTSVPYWKQRSYLPVDHPEKHLEVGDEATPALYVEALVGVFRELRRTLTDDGTIWVNVGQAYARASSSGSLAGSTLGGSQSAQRAYRAPRPGRTSKVRATKSGKQGGSPGVPPGFKDKDLIPLAWMLGLALQQDGWWLRLDGVWAPPNAMPESVTDRPTHVHEYVLLLSKAPRYYYDADAIREPQAKPDPRHAYHPDGRNARSVWAILTDRGDGEHAAPMPRALARRCILAGSAFGDWVLDPFGGSGTVAAVAEAEGRNATSIDLDERAIDLARGRTVQAGLVPST
jgi:site-specific DNA-methyltransferase (cytosine-N4-specific)